MTLACPEGERSCMIAGGHRSAGGFRPRPQANVAQPLGREADPAEHGRWLSVRGRVGEAALFIGEAENVYYT